MPTEVERLRRADCLAATVTAHLNSSSARSRQDVRDAVDGYRHLSPAAGVELVLIAPPDGAALIGQERERQQHAEAFTVDHDDSHTDGALALAAWAYLTEHPAFASDSCGDDAPEAWPWTVGEWKLSPDPVRNLVKAGALIAAEIDRLQRASLTAELDRLVEAYDVDPQGAA